MKYRVAAGLAMHATLINLLVALAVIAAIALTGAAPNAYDP
jgi:hypothetical protein